MNTDNLDIVEDLKAEWACLWERRHRFTWLPRTNKVQRKGYREMRRGGPE